MMNFAQSKQHQKYGEAQIKGCSRFPKRITSFPVLKIISQKSVLVSQIIPDEQ